MTIETREVEAVVKQQEIVVVTCSRCGREAKRLPKTAPCKHPVFPFAGVFIRGTLLTAGMNLAVPTEWELCNGCGFELQVWIEKKEGAPQ